MKNEFDELLRERFDAEALEGYPPRWSSVAAQLDNKKGGSGRKFWLLLPAAAMAASIAFAVVSIKPAMEAGYDKAIAKNIPSVRSAHRNNNRVFQTETTEPSYTTEQNIANTTRENISETQATHQLLAMSFDQSYPEMEAFTDNTPKAQQPVRLDFTGNKTVLYNNLPSEDEDDRAKVPTSLSLSGGLNYGSMNTGYAFGINTRTKVSRKLYVEGDLAYINNDNPNASSVTTATSTTTFATAATSEPGTSFLITGFGNQPEMLELKTEQTYTVVKSLNTLSYVQFTPSLGYEFTSRISMSLGADVQRLLQAEKQKTFVYNDDQNQVIPSMDYGLSGKAEVSVTNRLKAGVQYRQGLNNLVRGDDNYLDRKYVQVQLKFRFVGK